MKQVKDVQPGYEHEHQRQLRAVPRDHTKRRQVGCLDRLQHDRHTGAHLGPAVGPQEVPQKAGAMTGASTSAARGDLCPFLLESRRGREDRVVGRESGCRERCARSQRRCTRRTHRAVLGGSIHGCEFDGCELDVDVGEGSGRRPITGWPSRAADKRLRRIHLGVVHADGKVHLGG